MKRDSDTRRLSRAGVMAAIFGISISMAMGHSDAASAHHLYEAPDCSYADSGIVWPCAEGVDPVAKPPGLPPSCGPSRTEFSLTTCFRELSGPLPASRIVKFPADCLGEAFDPLACLDQLAGVGAMRGSDETSLAIPLAAQRPPVPWPPICTEGFSYTCAREMVVEMLGQNCIIQIGTLCPDDIAVPLPPISDPTAVAVEMICPVTPEYVPHWLGNDFEGIHPDIYDRVCEPPDPILGRTTQTTVEYGSCSAPDGSACTAPLQVQAAPMCERRYSLYRTEFGADGVGKETPVYPYNYILVKGGTLGAASFDGGTTIEVYTGTTTVSISGEDPAQVRRAADAIRPMPSDLRTPIGIESPIAASFVSGESAAQTEFPPPPVPGLLQSALECVPALSVSPPRMNGATLEMPVKNVFMTTAVDVIGTPTVKILQRSHLGGPPRFVQTPLPAAHFTLRPGRRKLVRVPLTDRLRRELSTRKFFTLTMKWHAVGRIGIGPERKQSKPKIVYERDSSSQLVVRGEG
jgi:hypothetical protein